MCSYTACTADDIMPLSSCASQGREKEEHEIYEVEWFGLQIRAAVVLNWTTLVA